MRLKHKYRLFIVQACILFLFVLIWTQLFKLQVIQSTDLNQKVKNQFFKPSLQLRGDIRDRYGNLLALDLISYDVYNNVRDINKVSNNTIQGLSKLLNIPSELLYKKLSQKRNTKIFSEINEQQGHKVAEFRQLAYLVPKAKRAYPHKKMASQLIGFVNTDRVGQHGIEFVYDWLIKKPSEENDKTLPYIKGTDIALTIDSILQEYAEEELEKAVTSSKALKGTIIALSPVTGEIYAWAVYPNFDPNVFYKEKFLKNWATTDIYEPGSTFKVITLASAIENMTINKDSRFFDNGSLQVGKRTIRNHHKTKPQYLSLLEVLKQSSNVAAAQIALSMKPEVLYNSIKRFMIGEKTNIDLPGESRGLLVHYKNWREIDHATTAFGQGAISLTPIQLATAISAIANHGMWTKPHVLKGIWNSKYKIISSTPNHAVSSQIISQETADFISSLLTQSVEENLKAMAYIAGDIPGYKVAGKTGTAQKVNPNGKGYLPGQTVASFVGYLPAESPKVLILVVIDDPKTLGRWGNTVCGPVFNNVAKMAARRIIANANQKKINTDDTI